MPIEIAKMFPDAQITGIDLGETLLDIGNRLVDEAGLSDRIILKKGDVQKMEFPDDSFDVVINTFLLHIVDEPVQMLNEIERVAKPGGIILITDLRRGFLANFVKKFRMSHTLDEALEMIAQSNLRKGKPGKGLFWWDYFCGLG
jgi:ubiquinone/menaquinone biosynthesis C-methylase UbiE